MDLLRVTAHARLHGRRTGILDRPARGAHVFFREAAFANEDRDHAKRSGHLTAGACGVIARAAGVEQVMPFHFSRRYESRPRQLSEEVTAAMLVHSRNIREGKEP